MKVLTDDSIDNFVVDIIEFLDQNISKYNQGDWPRDWFNNDQCYDAFFDKVHELLEPYSNGYRNYN